jgi:hypothetical protein
MECWNCNIESAEVVNGPPGLAVCYPCIKKTDEAADFPMVGTCTFCNGKLSVRYGGFFGGQRRACLVRESQALCNDCLHLMKDIVESEEDKRGAAT